MDDHDNTASPRYPSVRIWLCGPFSLEWVDPTTGQASPLSEQAFHERDGVQALSLLKLLLCQPGRQAHRDWVLEQFWPEHAQSVASHRLHNIASIFRKLLCPPDGLPLLPPISGRTDSRSLYTLPAYPRIWIDSDAIIWNIEQAARMERFGDDALPFWQRAFDLLKRGPFLLDEPYASWAQTRRTELEGAYRQCVHALSHLYLTRYGDAGKAEALLHLRTYWQQHPADEDALRMLMELLGELGRFQEAEECYQQCCLALRELGPSKDGQLLMPDPRTQDLCKYLQAKQIQRERPLLYSTEGDSCAAPSSSLALTRSSEMPTRFSETITQSISEIAANTQQDSQIHNILYSKSTAIPTSTYALVPSTISQLDTFDSAQPLCIDETTPEALVHFAALTNACRYLSEGNELQVAERTLWAYLPRVETIAKLSFEDQRTAADIASQGYLLAASLAGHHNDLQARHRYSEQALLYGKLAEDRNLQIAALRQLSITFDYLERPDKVLLIYQQAFPYLGEVSPLLRACVYAGVSGAYAQLKQKPKALHYMKLAYEHFPTHPEHEPGFLHTICRYSTLVFFDGLNHLTLGQPHEAEKVLAQIDGCNPSIQIPERVRIEALNYQIEVFIALNAIKQACTYLETAVQAALAIGSKRRLQESFSLFQQMKEIWPNESRVQELTDLFVH
jgi:DNA-binding SARP family transcriptional activator